MEKTLDLISAFRDTRKMSPVNPGVLCLLRHSKHKTTNIWCPFHYASFLELETQLRRDFHINFLSECFPGKTPQATNLAVIAIYLFSRLNMQKHTLTGAFSFPSNQMFR